VSLDTTDPWAVVASADYAISLNGNASGTSTLEVVATVSGTQVGRNLSSASTGSGRLEVIADLDLSAFSGTVSVDIEIITRSKASTTDAPNFDSASANTGDLGNDPNDPTTNVISSTDFFGPDGAVWRAGGQVQVEVNGRGNSSSQTTGAGQIWVRDKVIENSDLRNKSGVETMTGGLDVVRNLKGITYDRGAGIAAQDLIGTFEDALHGSEKGGYSVAYNALWAPAIDAIQSLDDRLSQVEDQINA